MKIIIEIECDISTFENEPNHEVGRILSELADQVVNNGINNQSIYDLNYIKVGNLTVGYNYEIK